MRNPDGDRWRLWAAGLALVVLGGLLLTMSLVAGIIVLVLGVSLVVAGGGGSGLGG